MHGGESILAMDMDSIPGEQRPYYDYWRCTIKEAILPDSEVTTENLSFLYPGAADETHDARACLLAQNAGMKPKNLVKLVRDASPMIMMGDHAKNPDAYIKRLSNLIQRKTTEKACASAR